MSLNKYLITGITGFIGRRLSSKLVSVVGVDNVVAISRTQHPIYKTILCDFQSDVLLENEFEGIDTVYHLAGYAHDLRNAKSISHLYQVVNIDATTRLASLAALSGVNCFVFVSSVKAGGSPIAGKCATELD